MNTVLFPVSIPTPKSSSRVERMKLHIHGIIDHGHNHRQFYGSLDHWSHGSDYIATLLLHYINTKVYFQFCPPSHTHFTFRQTIIGRKTRIQQFLDTWDFS